MADKNTPFVLPFKTDKKHYVYDVNTNRVFVVDHLVHDMIEYHGALSLESMKTKFKSLSSPSDIEQAYQEISKAQQKGLFSVHRPEAMAFGNDLDPLLENGKCEQLILNLTENCNLRCSYCIYSGGYASQRSHSNKTMSKDIALMSVDYFFQRCAKEVYVGFYGGEPLLEFEKLKKIVAYCRAKPASRINYSLTTNGVLLDEEKIRFFIRNGFSVTVSLDGPQHIHDRYRKTPQGIGTFDRVIENLQKFKDIDPEYYRQKVLFSVVNAPPLKLQQTADFFRTESLVKNNSLTTTYVDNAQNQFLKKKGGEVTEEEEWDTSCFYTEYMQQTVKCESISNYTKEFFDKQIIQFYKRPKTRLGDIFPNGCCIPGQRRLYVGVDGTLRICERADSLTDIGHIATGIDKGKIAKIVNDYIEMSQSCLQCPFCRLCSNCFASYIDSGILNADMRKNECASVQHSFLRTLILYYSILEDNESALDSLEEVVLG